MTLSVRFCSDGVVERVNQLDGPTYQSHISRRENSSSFQIVEDITADKVILELAEVTAGKLAPCTWHHDGLWILRGLSPTCTGGIYYGVSTRPDAEDVTSIAVGGYRFHHIARSVFKL